jgi:hypothetical protein
MRTRNIGWLGAIAVATLGLFVAACTNNSRPVLEAQYSARIVGLWQGTVGDSKETMTIQSDGTFVCQLHPMGFIANTLSQGVSGSISGKWNITGSRVTLTVTAAQNERLANGTASSTIVSFNEDTLVLRSDRGETSSFRRVHRL